MNLFIRKKAYIYMDRYDVLDDLGRLIYTMDGKITLFGGSLTMRDRSGTELIKLKKKPNPFFGNFLLYDLEEAGETQLADIRQNFSVRPKFTMTAWNEKYTVRGNIKACDYDIFNSGSSYAMIRKRALRWGNTYVLSLQSMENAPVFCSLAAALDATLFRHS